MSGAWLGMVGEFEKLAYEAALRGLDKQEGQLEELRARTGVLLAASSLAASFLGQQAFRHPHPRVLAVAALLAFVVSMGSSVFISRLRDCCRRHGYRGRFPGSPLGR